MKCVICFGNIEKLRDPKTGEVAWDQGSNALPVKEGRCCGMCNLEVVLPARGIPADVIEALYQRGG
tara:strand:+ start:317 stop:514 length:198 start_codon:yes stop_codon:yes gene_type:complete